MAVTVRIPTILRSYTAGAAEVSLSSGTVGEAFTALEGRFPGICSRILDTEGKLRRFINVYVEDDDIRGAEDLQTATPDGSSVTIIPAVAGGC
ncbi:MoaD/ThiS family protein [Streptomyces sp. ISL-10]|uniref:MoaD/ThiS family protein n=1 Tax=Streptomyces sp. ISL-10 TaxID=2819172 RepID=UPI001BEAB20B|nr:MoaD/ThiS family protein [Streptomyces sp. ISL-10]MBT2369952.1 MoaD/ThiS family protein [Streptomyces sp. ISL-10]